jgi:hypothetical protein
MSRKDRVAFHAQRVVDEAPMGQFLDSLNTGMTPEEIKECLLRIRAQVSMLERDLRESNTRKESKNA